MIKHSRFIAAAVLGLCILLALIVILERRAVGDRMDISPDALHALIVEGDSTLFLLDVRTAEEYFGETGHLENSVLIPVQELKQQMAELRPYRNKTIVAYCRTGRRSAHAADMLRAEGFTVLNLTGGIQAWSERNFPVSRKNEQ
jgi:rhodanese-related sulfurtransferase